MSVCVRLYISCACAALFSCTWFLYRSLPSVCVCVSSVCVSMSGWEKPGGTEHKDTSEEAHRQHPSNSPPSFSLSLIQSPSSLLQRWACTLAVAPAAAAEARLLFKAASSFGLFSLFFFFFLLLLFADVNRVTSQSFMPLPHTHLIYKTTKKEKNEWKDEEAQNKMGTTVAMLFLPAPHPRSLASGKTHFQSFPPVLPTTPRFRLVAAMGFTL